MRKLSILLLFAAASTPTFAFQYDNGPKRGLWDIGGYLGFDFGCGGLKSEKGFADTNKKMDAIGGGFRIAGGPKLPFLRVGLEAGGALTNDLHYNLFWRKQDYGRVKISRDDSRLVGREIAMGLVWIF